MSTCRTRLVFFSCLFRLTGGAVGVCSVSLSASLSLDLLFDPVLEFSSLFSDGLLLLVIFFFFLLSNTPLPVRLCFLADAMHLYPYVFSTCAARVSSLVHLYICKHSSFCPPLVCRALVSIKWASLLLQKDSLKCQRDRGECLILSPYLSWCGTTIIKITGLI